MIVMLLFVATLVVVTINIILLFVRRFIMKSDLNICVCVWCSGEAVERPIYVHIDSTCMFDIYFYLSCNMHSTYVAILDAEMKVPVACFPHHVIFVIF